VGKAKEGRARRDWKKLQNLPLRIREMPAEAQACKARDTALKRAKGGTGKREKKKRFAGSIFQRGQSQNFKIKTSSGVEETNVFKKR